ncbi:uncharacterized protein LOC135136040 [Zophobas morio]|uniref:uncharacterized protein LOC135136040 n=1 Tax=Zophobas morio TaxID=2755281 RepID=UPI0030829DDC
MVVNYRPISILSNLSKVFESILHKYIYNAIKLNISISQYGFMERRSTITNLVTSTFCQYLSENMDTQIQTDAIFTDFIRSPVHLMCNNFNKLCSTCDILEDNIKKLIRTAAASYIVT